MITQIQKIEFDGIFSIKPYLATHMAPLFGLDQVLHHHNDTTKIEFNGFRERNPLNL